MSGKEQVSERFRRLLGLYQLPDGGERGGREFEDDTGRKVTHSYVANLRKGRIEDSGLARLEAISKPIKFPPALWFKGVEERTRIKR